MQRRKASRSRLFSTPAAAAAVVESPFVQLGRPRVQPQPTPGLREPLFTYRLCASSGSYITALRGASSRLALVVVGPGLLKFFVFLSGSAPRVVDSFFSSPSSLQPETSFLTELLVFPCFVFMFALLFCFFFFFRFAWRAAGTDVFDGAVNKSSTGRGALHRG